MEHSQPESQDWAFHPTRKIDARSHRTVEARETLGRLRGHTKRVPITRISDLTPLDRLRLPVYSATTPLALDLTTHMGKGVDTDSAQVSAIVEAIERVSAEEVEAPVRRCSFRRLAEDAASVIDGRAFDLPDDSSYTDDAIISWVEGWDLLHDKAVWLPVDVVISPPRDGVLRDIDTNGLAAGNSLLEAVVHGLCEAIERDALGSLLFHAIYGDSGDRAVARHRISPESLPAQALEWADRIRSNGLDLETEVLPTDVGVAIFRSVVVDHHYPSASGTRKFVGLGASPNAAIAVVRSITEAVQSRLAVIQGARDSFNHLAPPRRRSTLGRDRDHEDVRDCVPFSTVPTFSTDDLLDDLRHLLACLRAAGFDRVIAVNLSRRAFGVPVVRIRVPGLSSFAVNRKRVGWRSLRYLL